MHQHLEATGGELAAEWLAVLDEELKGLKQEDNSKEMRGALEALSSHLNKQLKQLKQLALADQRVMAEVHATTIANTVVTAALQRSDGVPPVPPRFHAEQKTSLQPLVGTVDPGMVELSVRRGHNLRKDGQPLHKSCILYRFRPGSRAKKSDAREGATGQHDGDNPDYGHRDLFPYDEENLKEELLKAQSRASKYKAASRDKDLKMTIVFYVRHQEKGWALFKGKEEVIANGQLPLTGLLENAEIQQRVEFDGCEGSVEVKVNINKPLSGAATSKVEYQYIVFEGFNDELGMRVELDAIKQATIAVGKAAQKAGATTAGAKAKAQYDAFKAYLAQVQARLAGGAPSGGQTASARSSMSSEASSTAGATPVVRASGSTGTKTTRGLLALPKQHAQVHHTDHARTNCTTLTTIVPTVLIYVLTGALHECTAV